MLIPRSIDSPCGSGDCIMAFSRFLIGTLVCAVVLKHFCSAFAFPLQACALEDIPQYSDLMDREWLGQEHLSSILKEEPVQRLQDLGRISDAKEFLERTFLSPGALRAGRLIRTWMIDAGLFTWIDDFGNIHGRFDGVNASAPALLIGSHLDTVVDGGQYDGALGIISAIAAVKALKKTGRLVDFPRPIEVIAFSDEEGVRFQSTFLGSGAIAGTLSPSVLQVKDKRGITLQEALQSSHLVGTAESLSNLRYDPHSVWGYVEIHIEQGPVLESKGLPLGVVDAIAGQTRLRVTMKGSAGHAGTVPMSMRRDPMPAAAHVIVAIDELCMDPGQTFGQGTSLSALVCTVGEIASWPGASNVIPGEVIFSIDVRAKHDSLREQAVSTMETIIFDVCKNRAISCNVERKHEANTVECDSALTESLGRAASYATNGLARWTGGAVLHQADAGYVPTISSGAGHDALALAHLTQVGMLFVRCKGGISHSPLEDVSDDDIWAASLAMYTFLDLELPHTFDKGIL